MSSEDGESALVRLVTEHDGPPGLAPEQVPGHIRGLARRRDWTLEEAEAPALQSFRAARWFDRYGGLLGLTLCRGGIVAVVPEGDEDSFADPRTYLSGGLLWDALSADGRLILPEPDWLAAPMTPRELVMVLTSGHEGGWEAYSVRSWKPTSRGAALFNPWD